MIKQAIILAGGKGTRLKNILNGKPKPLVEINNKPLLKYQIDLLIKYKIKSIIILANYKIEQIEDFVNHEYSNQNIKVLDDGISPLGTGGCLIKYNKIFEKKYIVLYGDTYLDIDLSKMIEFHLQKKSDLTLFTHPNSHPFDSDIVIESENKVLEIKPYPHKKDFFYKNLVNAALYILNKNIFADKFIINKNITDFAKDLIPQIINNNKKVFSYNSKEYIKDCGTENRILSVINDLKNNIPFKSRKISLKKIIFIDRDGTLIKSVDQLNKIEQVEIFDNSFEAIKILNKKGFVVALVTNQPVIARGELSIEGLKNIHDFIEWELGKNGAYLDQIKFCPHHPHKGFDGEIVELKINCECRKPKTQLIQEVIKEFNGDLKNSWIIGDTTVDIKTGKNSGLRSILVKTGFAGKDRKYNVEPDFIFNDILESVNYIINDNN